MSIKKLVRKTVKSAAIACYYVMNRLFCVNKQRIVLSASLGKSYSGNPKAIYELLVKKELDKEYDCIWFYENEPFDIPGRHRQVRFGRFKYLYFMATSGFWIFDARQPEFLRKRDRVIYLQTWHGTPLKKLGLDMEAMFMAGETDVDSYKESFRKNASSWDYLISQNDFSSNVFRRAFDFKGIMLETGYPRNDVLFEGNNPDNITKLKKKLGLPENKKVLLYAPTWRDDEASGIGRYHFSNALDIDLMKERFGEEAVLIIKYHYLVKDNIDWTPYKDFVYVYTQEVDIAQLYLVSNILITDYSSAMFDYCLLKRPVFFYCYDLERYKDVLRGFYFDFEHSAPGPISKTTRELIEDIITEFGKEKIDSNLEETEYASRYNDFVAMYNPWDDGNASEKVIESIFDRGNDN